MIQYFITPPDGSRANTEHSGVILPMFRGGSLTKKLVQMFVLVATGAATYRLVEGVKPSLAQPAIAVGALAIGAVVLGLLEMKYVLPLNWWWHRFWYLREFGRYAREMQRHDTNLRDHARKSSKLWAVEVIVGDSRRELVPWAVARLRTVAVDPARLFVQGEPGSGKSFAALQIADELARAAQWRPWIAMPVLGRLDRYRDGSLEAYLAIQVLMTTASSSGKIISDGLDKLMRKGRVTLILDALDETPEGVRTKLLAELANFAKPSRNRVALLITARSRDILVSEVQLPLESFEIQPLSDSAVATFIEVYAGST